MKKGSVNNISSEVLAAYLDGNATAQECQDVLGALALDAELREVLRISQLVDADLGLLKLRYAHKSPPNRLYIQIKNYFLDQSFSHLGNWRNRSSF